MNYTIWIVIILLLAILICLITPDSLPIPELKPQPIPVETYDLIEKLDQDAAIERLKKYSKKARQIVPQFPDFPTIWLLPPKEKGGYGSIPERYSIEFMELLFPGHQFKKVRPSWLKNTLHERGRNLELDGYCEELALAIEYNGEQHYEWPNFTRMTEEEFKRQKERDQLKAQICIERNICLLRIPYTVPLNKIPLAIYSKLLDGVPGYHP